MLHDLARRLDTLNIELLFARAKKQIVDTFKRTGFLESHGKEKFFRTCAHAMEYAWKQLEDGHKETCPLHVTKLLSDIEQEEIEAAEEAEATAVKQEIAPAPDSTTEVVVTKVDVTKV